MSLALVGLVIITGVIGIPTATVAAKRVTTLTYDSPAAEVHFTCGSWVLAQPELDLASGAGSTILRRER